MKLFALLSSIACAAARLRFVAPEAPLAVPVSHPDSGSIVISRTVNTDDKAWATGKVTVGPSGTCKSSDDYGSNDCTMNWGTNYTLDFTGTLGSDLSDKAHFEVNLKVDRIISWKFQCPLCGSYCETKIPVIGKDVNISLPACPLAAGSISETGVVVPIPEAPKGLPKTSVSGTVKVFMDDGSTLGEVSLTAGVEEGYDVMADPHKFRPIFGNLGKTRLPKLRAFGKNKIKL